jgi:hypothetical protein
MTKNLVTTNLAADIDAWAQMRLAELRVIAENIATEWKAADSKLKVENGKPQGRLAVRIRDAGKRATPGAFLIDWMHFWHIRTKGKRPMYRSEYIPRGHGVDRYPASAFAGHIYAWQRALVAETEARFAGIRAEAREIAAVRSHYRAAERRAERRRAADEEQLAIDSE